MQENNQGSGWMFIPVFIGYVLCFAVPAVVLSLLFPKYTGWFIIAAYALMSIGVGIIAGSWWNRPEMTEELRRFFTGLAEWFLIIMPIASISYEAIREQGWEYLVKFLALDIAFIVLVYASFFISRTRFRRSVSVAE